MNIFTQCNVYISQITSQTPKLLSKQDFNIPRVLSSLLLSMCTLQFSLEQPRKIDLPVVPMLTPVKSSQFLQCFPLS
jgi:hypothetical protein